MLTSVAVDVLPIDRTHSRDKSPKKARTRTLFSLRYCDVRFFGDEPLPWPLSGTAGKLTFFEFRLETLPQATH